MNLTYQLELLARRLDRRRLAVALCWAAAAIVAVALGLMALDWATGASHAASRVFLTATLLLAIAALCRRLARSVRGRTTPLQVALEIERRRPELRSLLASGIEFDAQEADDVTAGSLKLRKAVVVQAALAAEAADLETTVPRLPIARPAAAAGVALAVVAVIAMVAPEALATGAARLVNPLSRAEWPRRHDLAFDDHARVIPKGAAFHAVLRDRRGSLPRTVEIQFRTRRDGRWRTESEAHATSGDSLDVRKSNVVEPLEYRAIGGDHMTMPWQRVEVAPAPQIEALELVVQPPAYTGRPAQTLEPPLRILAGSTVTFRAATTVAVRTAELRCVGQPAYKLAVGVGGRTVASSAAPWQPAANGEWQFHFTTPAGMGAVGEQKLRVEVQPDLPPSIEIVSTERELTLLPTAVVNLELAASDDVGLRDIRLSGASENSPDVPAATTVELFKGPDQLSRSDAAKSNNSPPKELDVRQTLDLAMLNCSPGELWKVHGLATDYAGQTSESPRPLRLRIVNREDLLRELNARMGRLVQALSHVAGEQRSVATAVDGFLQPANGADEPKLKEVRAAAARQRGVSESLARGGDSALENVAGLSEEFRRNRVDDGDARFHLERLSGELQSLDEATLPAIESNLAADLASERLSAARQGQEQVLAVLDGAIRQLSRWSDRQQFALELGELRAEQLSLLDRTKSLGRQALENLGDEPPADHERRREEALTRQRALTGWLASLTGRLEDAAAALASSQPSEAARLDSTLQTASARGVQVEVAAAADHLAAKRFSQAAESQQTAANIVQQMLDRLQEGGAGAAGDRLAKLHAALSRLAEDQQIVVDEAARLHRLMAVAENPSDNQRADVARLAARQELVIDRAAAQEKDVEEFPVFAGHLQAAIGDMDLAERELAGGNVGAAASLPAELALERLRQLADALQQHLEQPAPPDADQAPSDQQQAQAGQNKAEQIRALQLTVAQLGLLQSNQSILRDETLAEERAAAEETREKAKVAERVAGFAGDQGQLAELAELLAESSRAGEGAESPGRSLQSIADRMRQAESALEASDVSGRASSLQLEAMSAIDAAIEQLQQQCKACGGQCNKPSTAAKKSQKPSDKPGASPGESSATLAEDADWAADKAAIRNLVDDLWGKLPERQRQELVQPLSEEFLPEYAAEIEAYFRALAEPAEVQERRP